jgi:hypothetical protein
MLACVYDEAKLRRASGKSPLYVQIAWRDSDVLIFQHRQLSRNDVRKKVIDATGLRPELLSPMPEIEVQELWAATETSIRVQADEWASWPLPLTVLAPSEEAIQSAQNKLKNML